MEEEQQEPDRPPPSAARHGAEGDSRDWSGAQVVANADHLLLGNLDEEFTDNPDAWGAGLGAARPGGAKP